MVPCILGHGEGPEMSKIFGSNCIFDDEESIQRSNYEVVQDEADEFAMKEDEEPRELYRRLNTLAVSL